MYLFGPLINAPPAHPDTVLTSVMYMMKSLTDLGMTSIHLSPNAHCGKCLRVHWSVDDGLNTTMRRHVCLLYAVTGWTTSSPCICSFTSCCASKERGIGSFNSSAFDISSRTFSSQVTTTMQHTSHGIASKWLYYCLPWQMMTYSLAHLSADTRRAAGMQCWPTNFGEQTAKKIGKGGLKGNKLSPEQVAEWIDSFPISA